MRIDAISNTDNTNFKGLFQKFKDVAKPIEGAAETLQVKTNPNRKSIPIELHNALVRLTAYRMALLFAALSGFLGFKVADKIADNDNEDFANAVQSADIDTNANIEIKDMNKDGSVDIVLQTKDSTTMILDLKNAKILMETTGFKEVE